MSFYTKAKLFLHNKLNKKKIMDIKEKWYNHVTEE